MPSCSRSTAARTAERGTFPHAPGHQLERPGADFLAGTGDADDDAFAPALVAALQRLAHHVRIARAVEAVVGTAVGELDEIEARILAAIKG